MRRRPDDDGAAAASSMYQSLKDDIAAVEASPYLKHVDVRGFVFDIEHGGVEEVK